MWQPLGDNQDMTGRDAIRQWTRIWVEASPELERIRLREVRDEDHLLSLRLLAVAFNQATRAALPDRSPGLVEMQAYFAKLRQ